MPEHIRGRVKPMGCLFERALLNMGFMVVHDGSKEPTDINWLKSGEPTFYTKVLRARVDGEFINTWVKFTYDLRTGLADFTISYRDMTAYEEATTKMDDRIAADNETTAKNKIVTKEALDGVTK